MTNVVLLVKNRKLLTEQCLNSLYKNTPNDQFTLTICDDGSDLETLQLVAFYGRTKSNCRVIHLGASIGIVGFLRNVGASASERYFGRGEYVMFLDCDTALFPNWLQKMTFVMAQSQVKILGGHRHPFHGVNETEHAFHSVELTDAVAGYSMMMTWETYDKYGPFSDNQKGVGASEDWAMCRKIVEAGGSVGYIHPPVLAHTGVTNTDGKPATGADSFRRVEGILYE